MNYNIFNSIKFNFLKFAPKFCVRACRVKRSLQEDFFLHGYRKFRDEIQIVNMVKEIRIVKAAVQSLLTEQQWKFFKKEYAMRLLWLSEQQKSKTENKCIIKPDQD